MNTVELLTGGTPERRAQMQRVHQALYQMHIWPTFRGYSVSMAAVWLVLEDSSRLTAEAAVTRLYLDVGQLCGMSWWAAERNIRRIVQRAWDIAPDQLDAVAGMHLQKRPTASQFIGLLTAAALMDSGEGQA